MRNGRTSQPGHVMNAAEPGAPREGGMKNRTRHRLPGGTRWIAAVLVAVSLAADARAGDDARWPRFRGIGGRGVASDSKPLPVRFGPDQGVAWKTRLPGGHSSPCIWGRRIFLTGFDPKAKRLETLCLDRRSGDIVWRRVAPAERIEQVHRISSPAVPTPATDGRRVYVYFGSFGLLCYDVDGRERWRHPLPIPNKYFGSGSSPIVAGKLVLQNVDHQGESFLLAVDGRTGKPAWRVKRALFQRGWSTPVHHARRGGRDEVIVLGGSRLVAYGLRDGRERWSIGGLPPFPISSPVIADGRLFMATSDEFGAPDNVVHPPPFDQFAGKHDRNRDGIIARDEIPESFLVLKRHASDGAGDTTLKGWFFGRVDLDKDGSLNRKEWNKFVADMTAWPAKFNVVVLGIRLGGEGDVTKSHVEWRATRSIPEVPSPLCYDGRLYTIKNGGIIVCRNAATGRELYRRRLGAGGGYYASPVAGDGKVYTASDQGVVTVVKAGDRYEFLARNDLGEPIMATPAIVGGTLYVRTEHHLYAFDR